MSTSLSGSANLRYNPDEPRDQHGRWTAGGSSWRNNPLRNPSAAGRAHTLLGHALASACHQGLIREFKLPTQGEAKRFSKALAAWNAASNLNDERFCDRFTHGLVDDLATVRRLRQAAAGSVTAQTFGQMVDASRPLTAAIKDIGAHRWTDVREELEERAGVLAANETVPLSGLAAGDAPGSSDLDGTHGDYGDNTKLEVIKKQIYEALKGKKAIAIVGGAGDKWFSESILQFLKDIKNKYPGAKVEYFTHDQDDELKKWLNEQGKTYGSDSVGLIGHSWGGDTAATVVAHGAKVGALITIDPVSHFPPNLEDVKANTKNWINVNANPDKVDRAQESGPGNIIAGLGGAWNDDPKGYADHHYNANINHADAWKVLLSPEVPRELMW